MKYLFTVILVFFIFCVSYSQSYEQVQTKTVYVYIVKDFEQGSILNWEISGGKILSENSTQADSVVVEWYDVGLQKLSVYEESTYNCIGETYSINVEVTDANNEIELDIPNAFTPNNDGINDLFTIKSNGKVEDYELRIINRWGNELYKSNSLSDSWNGKYNGKTCSPSTYFYIISYLHNGQKKTKNGFLELFY